MSSTPINESYRCNDPSIKPAAIVDPSDENVTVLGIPLLVKIVLITPHCQHPIP